MNRALIVDATTGTILRVLTAPPSMIAANARPGEAAFVITNDDGLFLDDGRITVSEAGALIASDGLTAPGYDLQYVAA